jgi:putative oxidoreductase
VEVGGAIRQRGAEPPFWLRLGRAAFSASSEAVAEVLAVAGIGRAAVKSPLLVAAPPRYVIYMKYIPIITAAILGFLFVMGGIAFFMHWGPAKPFPDGSPGDVFMGLFGPSGYMAFVKVLEITGGVLIAIPRTRNFGLLVLGPIIINILAFQVFILKGEQLLNPVNAMIVVLPVYLLWCERRAFAGLLR